MYLVRAVTTLLTVRTVAIALLVLTLTACGSSSNGGKGGAYEACKRAVASELKAPATADFSGPFSSTITEHSDGTYDVVGYVDSENSFGANIRSDWTCTVRSTGDNWDLVDLNVT
jgi:hypothetical protein